jgi:aryl-alcohol dehydrogenase-like predicted oxidoreductase
MTFGTQRGDLGADRDECKKVFDAFVNAGGNFFNSANRYMNGEAETILGELIAGTGDRERCVIATKYTSPTNPDDPNATGNHRKNMVQAVKHSLERLGTDYLDLLLIHMWDPLTPIEELMRGLDDLVKSGKVIYIGVSDTPAFIVSRANTIAELRGWTPFIAYEIPYSLAERTVEREMIPMADYLGMTVTPWSPLGGGILTAKYNEEGGTGRLSDATPSSRNWMSDRNKAIAAEVARVAQEIGRTPAQVALNWVRQQAGKKLKIPIIGARTGEQAIDDLGCLDFELSKEHLDALSETSQIELGFPGDWFTGDSIRGFTGGNYTVIP